MKKNVSFILKIMVLSVMFMFVACVCSYAADVIDLNNLDSYGFSDILNEESTAKASSTTQSSSSDKVTTPATTGTTSTVETPATTTNKVTTSSSKEDIPATGSNTEVIFIIGTAVILSVGAVAFKKQRIKLK